MMKKHDTILPAVLMAILLVPACSQKESLPQARCGIRFASPLQTRATDAVNNADVFQVRDWYNGSSYHINNTLKWNASDSRWDYGTAADYEWAGGQHLFFSWLEHNESYSTAAFFGTGLRANRDSLIIPAKTMSTSVHQYDFMYSNPVSRNTSGNDYSDVPLVFNHLFAQVAMSFQISNDTPNNEQPIFLYGAYLNDRFRNVKKTAIKFNEDGTADVVLTDVTDTLHPIPFSARQDFGGISYPKGATPIDMLSQRQSNTKDFYYFWPATEAELDEVIDIVYKIAGETDIRTSSLSFPKGTNWKGGHKYSYTVTYMGGIFKVEESVKDWNYTELAASAEDQSAMASWIGWDSATCSISGRNISFKTDAQGRLMTIHGMFKIFSPTLCTYHINLSQNVNFYTFTPNDGVNVHTGSGSIGTSTGDTHPGVTIDFYISARDDDRPAAGQPPITADLSFSVQATGGREFSLDSELQRDGAYTIIIPSM
jgi:hypothetical protein